MKIKPLQIYQADKETRTLYLQAVEKFDLLSKSERLGSFNWEFRDEGLFGVQEFSINGLFKFADVNEKKIITFIPKNSQSKKIKLFGVAFLGTPTELKKTLKKILDDMERKEKLVAFK